MAPNETQSDKMEIHWREDDGRMAMVRAERLRPRRLSVERILARNAVTEPMAIPFRWTRLRIAGLVLLAGIFLACVAGLLRQLDGGRSLRSMAVQVPDSSQAKRR